MTKTILTSTAVAILALSPLLMAGDVDLKGAVPGKWTMDLDAATKLAAKTQLPILIDFSGSDWCGWCKLMDKNVFAKQEWQDYAKTSMIMVLIDSPKDKSIVPEEYVERNEKLKEEYGVEGFPTFILLDSDGETELTRLGAGKDKTPAKFIQEITIASRYRSAEVERYTKTLKDNKKAEYLNLVRGITAKNDTIKAKKQQITEAYENIKSAQTQIAELKLKAAEFRAAGMGADKLKEYKALEGDMEKAKAELEAWLKSEPEKSEANMKKFQSMSGEIKDISSQLAEF